MLRRPLQPLSVDDADDADDDDGDADPMMNLHCDARREADVPSRRGVLPTRRNAVVGDELNRRGACAENYATLDGSGLKLDFSFTISFPPIII